ncbi:hypothetical protein B0H17DRAFT_1050795 [Mycena rosella]|uniref:Uncharacterized protein n=1 Tax=Mycena rosella TaxID=1033263 RepID=A0AAD7DT03_MYCRO|nr:hypothetical protein B0H17DRAFT_1050795 [Mycena rosella]
MSNVAPLTTHRLLHEDRTRLIRSTRKIGDIVGETPYFVDPSSFPLSPKHSSSKRHKRSKDRHALDAPASPTLPAAPVARPVLYLCVPESAPPERALATPSPTLTVALNIRHAVMKDDTARRRKMAKLVRTLGANVPKELVFPPPSANEVRRLKRLTARTTMSDRTQRPESVGAVQPPRRRSGVPDAPRRHSKVDSISHGWVWVGSREEIPSDVLARAQPDSGLPSDWMSVSKPVESPTVTTIRAMHRKEEGWSGEWAGAVHNMNDVVTRLRGLKVK